MKKISVNIITNREGGIDAQLRYFAQQTFKDFEMVIVDELWDKRHNAIEALIKNLGLDVVYLKPRRYMEKVVTSTHTMARNEALTYMDAENVLFFDDYQIPMGNLLAEHVHYLRQKIAVVGQQINLNRMDINHPDFNNVKAQDNRNTGTVKEISYAWFWTNNASTPMSTMLAMNGVDERFNGATGGEDYAGIGLSLTQLGVKIIYNPSALCYHIDHDGIPEAISDFKRLSDNPIGNKVYSYQNHDHNLAAFVKNPYHNGNPNLMENEQFKCWRDKWGIKHYVCKYCGVEGVCDGLEIFEIKKRENNPVAPKELFDLQTAREGFKAERRDIGLDKYIR